MRRFLSAVFIAATLSRAGDLQVPLEVSLPPELDLYEIPKAAIALATYDLSEQRLVQVFGEQHPRLVSENEKLQLHQEFRRFLDITEHRDFTTRAVVPKSFQAPNDASSARASIFVDAVRDDLDGVVENMKTDLTQLTAFWTRSYKSIWGLQSSNWVFEHVSKLLRAHPSNEVVYSIRKFSHNFPQNSVIVRIESATSMITSSAREILILGSHLDSLNYKYPFFRAPGADDDGSGTVVTIQILRSLLEQSFVPPGNIAVEFHWYAGEEGGLLGSIDVASSYYDKKMPVKAMLQMDEVMVVLEDSGPLIALFDEDSNANLNAFGASLVEKYTTVPYKWTRCDGKCGSDHIPWNKTGYPSMPVSDKLIVFPPSPDETIHTVHDTMDQRGFNFTHGVEFVKLGLAWVIELAVTEF
ncbi:Zn-dependent exopeptidase [Flagelloscypha sp. PMI_526]|nr:Zn-dependent exopeptidase [Flagelloscypha sp. PMI_526]